MPGDRTLLELYNISEALVDVLREAYSAGWRTRPCHGVPYGGATRGLGGPIRADRMTVTLQLANQVRRLGREHMTVEQIANRLGVPEQAITHALCMLGLPLPGETVAEWPSLPDEERAALRARMPKRWQDRLTPLE